MKVKGVAMISRTLREGKTFDDYRKAWYHTHGFGVPAKMLTVVNLHNPREIISIGIMELEDISQLQSALHIDIEERLANPLDEVVEDTIVRKFGILVSEDDFSMAGKIPPKPLTIDGEEVKYTDLEEVMGVAADIFTAAAEERDRRRKEKGL
ncbi:MAG: ROK family protein [Actinomycetota bacterium]|nr:ROK family protein [Actinomycetota bacterium]